MVKKPPPARVVASGGMARGARGVPWPLFLLATAGPGEGEGGERLAAGR